jgi:hypothetical protein
MAGVRNSPLRSSITEGKNVRSYTSTLSYLFVASFNNQRDKFPLTHNSQSVFKVLCPNLNFDDLSQHHRVKGVVRAYDPSKLAISLFGVIFEGSSHCECLYLQAWDFKVRHQLPHHCKIQQSSYFNLVVYLICFERFVDSVSVLVCFPHCKFIKN